jgi:excisionase family DNA binding protein
MPSLNLLPPYGGTAFFSLLLTKRCIRRRCRRTILPVTSSMATVRCLVDRLDSAAGPADYPIVGEMRAPPGDNVHRRGRGPGHPATYEIWVLTGCLGRRSVRSMDDTSDELDPDIDWLTTDAVADVLGVSQTRVRQLVHKGYLPAVNWQGHYFFGRPQVEVVANARDAR